VAAIIPHVSDSAVATVALRAAKRSRVRAAISFTRKRW